MGSNPYLTSWFCWVELGPNSLFDMISESILNGSLCLLVVWYCDFCSLACIALSDRKVKCFFFSLSLAFWLSSYEWNKCLYNLAFLLFCWYMPSPYFIFPCSGIFWSWLRLLKLKMLRQRHIYLKLRYAIWLFLPLHTLTLISCNIIIDCFGADYWSSIWRYADTEPKSVGPGDREGWL